MELVLVRQFEVLDTPKTALGTNGKKRGSATIGTLTIDGIFECHTLEDIQRSVRVDGETAIPLGTYTVTLTHSPKFSDAYALAGRGRLLPRLHSVPGIEGILIHIGNYACDSEGCILVGSWTKASGNMISGSTAAYKALHKKLSAATDGIRITIRNEVADMSDKLKHPSGVLFKSLYTKIC